MQTGTGVAAGEAAAVGAGVVAGGFTGLIGEPGLPVVMGTLVAIGDAVAAAVGEGVAIEGVGVAAAVEAGVPNTVAVGEPLVGKGTGAVRVGVAKVTAGVGFGVALPPAFCRPVGMVGLGDGLAVVASGVNAGDVAVGVTAGVDAAVDAGEVPEGQRLQVAAQ